MNDEFEGKEPIKNLRQFNRHIELNTANFRDCVFLFPFLGSDSALLIEALTDEYSNFNGAVFTEDVEFEKINIDKPISLLNVTFKKSVIFKSLNFTDTFSIGHCTFHGIEFLSSHIKDLELINNKILGKFKISHSDTQQFSDPQRGRDVEKIKIGELMFAHNTIATEALIRFGYLDVNLFVFRNIHNPINSEINIGECNFNSTCIADIRNSGRFRMYNINTNKEKLKIFILTDSSLGNSEFQNVNLACYDNVIVRDTLLSGLQYTGVQWPKKIETEETDTDQKKRDTYRILKNVAQKNNDAPQAIAFYAEEMKAYSRTLSWKKGERIDVLILWINHLTNNFGLNWMWPIGWILGVGVVFYILLLCSLCLNGSFYNWTEFPVFLNPTHKTGFIDGRWGFWAYLFDLSFRLIEATLIYQTIIAFRKYTRKL